MENNIEANLDKNFERPERGTDVIIKVVLIRHGEKVITQKTVTTALTEEGKEQARRFGDSRKGQYLKAYYSPTDRTEETARLITEASQTDNTGVPRKREDDLSFGFKKGGEFIRKVQQFRKDALVPEAEGLSPEEIEQKINQLKEESLEEFNKRLKKGADQHTEYYLKFGSKKPEEETGSPVEIASRLSKLLLHYIELSKRLYSGSEIDLINVTHDVNVATFIVMVLRESLGQEDLSIGELGGSIEYTEECEVIIHRENDIEYSLKLMFRGKEYDISEDILKKLADAEYEK
jgi:broad specificity phosphatase PhoE